MYTWVTRLTLGTFICRKRKTLHHSILYFNSIFTPTGNKGISVCIFRETLKTDELHLDEISGKSPVRCLPRGGVAFTQWITFAVQLHPLNSVAYSQSYVVFSQNKNIHRLPFGHILWQTVRGMWLSERFSMNILALLVRTPSALNNTWSRATI